MRKRIAAIAMVFLVGLYSLASAGLDLGGVTLGTRPGRTIRADVSFRGGGPARALRTARFVGRVGGVAFGAVASPKGGAPTRVELSYRPRAADGQRVQVTLDGAAYVLEVPDWLVVPTARWAAQDTIELVTAFGQLKKPIPEADRRCMFVFNYAAAFEGTLAGLRLMQADLVAMSDAYGDLVRDDGRYILGAGEQAPDAQTVARRARLRVQTFARIGNTFRSYVLTDEGRTISFEGVGGRLALEGGPTYRLWRPAPNLLDDASRKTLADQLRGLPVAVLRERARALRAPLLEKIDGLDRSPADRAAAKKEISQLLDAADSPLVVADDLVEAVAALTALNLTLEIIYLPDTDNPLSDPLTIEALNPEVYRAVRSVAQTAAFFRYVRLNHPAAWKKFLREIRRVKVTPRVTLPTTMPKPCGDELVN